MPMTEQEWFECTNPWKMEMQVRYYSPYLTASMRKTNLLGIACCRRISELLGEESLRALDQSELYADGKTEVHRLEERGELTEVQELGGQYRLNPSHLTAARMIAASAVSTMVLFSPSNAAARTTCREAASAIAHMNVPPEIPHAGHDRLGSESGVFSLIPPPIEENKAQCALIRDIFGNPYHPIVFNSRWLSLDVVEIAQSIYDDRAFDRMPILADALMDAGCDNDEIIHHCRGPGSHVRGCWVLDMILGKS